MDNVSGVLIEDVIKLRDKDMVRGTEKAPPVNVVSNTHTQIGHSGLLNYDNCAKTS